MGSERRQHERWKVHRGHAEITNVAGPGADRCPRGQVRIVDWSRGGICLKIPSPTRKMLLFKNEPVLTEDDSIYCSLRLPPLYKPLDICADVVRIERDDEDPGALRVGLAYDDSVPPPTIDALAELLEKKSRSGRVSTSGRVSGRHKASSGKTRTSSGKTKAASGKARTTSGKVTKRNTGTSKRLRASAETQRIRSHGGGLSERVKSQRVRVPSSREAQRVAAEHRTNSSRQRRISDAQHTLTAAEESVRAAKESLRLAIESLQVARDSRAVAREQLARESVCAGAHGTGRQKRASQRALQASADGVAESQRLTKASRRAARQSQRLRRQ
ncbi:MAG: hypothetical protein CMF76_10255 [Maricaulis sp.]|nr:hypothetical protein [Maricaulis sp.]